MKLLLTDYQLLEEELRGEVIKDGFLSPLSGNILFFPILNISKLIHMTLTNIVLTNCKVYK